MGYKSSRKVICASSIVINGSDYNLIIYPAFYPSSLDRNQSIPNELRSITPPSAPSLETTRTAYELGELYPDQASFYNLISGEHRFTISSIPSSEFLRVNRARFRQWLTTDANVSWGKRYIKHTVETIGGKITVHFDDGTSATGDFLVGADGTSSLVGAILRPKGDSPNILPIATVGAELILDAEHSARAQALGKTYYIGGTKDQLLLVGLHSVMPEKSQAKYYWLLQWHDESIPEVGKEHWTFKASKAERLNFARQELTRLHAHKSLREIVDLQCEEGSQGTMLDAFLVRDRIPTRAQWTAPIALIGDSAHALPPYLARGANMACADAFTLGRLIVEEVRTAATFDAQKIISEYENEMIPRTTAWVLATRARAEYFDNTSVNNRYKP
jgi:2-polyprenyl-6-methoxyphenol hydroxylase-like FAD-dependent oxidoreductase